jgi:hypothetical protein
MQNFLRQLARAAQQSARQGGASNFGSSGAPQPSAGAVIGIGAVVAALFAGSAAIYNVNGATKKKKKKKKRTFFVRRMADYKCFQRRLQGCDF